MNHRHATQPRGFTLVELMISVAIALLLIVGVSQVFKLSGDTAGATAALGTMTRDLRAAQSTLAEDFRNSAVDSPLFLISSGIAYPSTIDDTLIPGNTIVKRGVRAGFRNLEDQQSALDQNDPTRYEINGTPYTTRIASLSDRMPRLDRLGFFARSFYRAQAPLDDKVTRNITSAEAFIWYGHLGLLGGQMWSGSDNTVMNDPDRGQNMRIPENQFANERVLGRAAILLKDSDELRAIPASPAELEFTNSIGGGPNDFKENTPGSGERFPPLDVLSTNFLNSRYDVAATTMDAIRQQIGIRYEAHPLNWFDVLDDRRATVAPRSETWFFRIGYQPKFGRPIVAGSLAKLVPYFIGNCTQFVVEYAGDFLNQVDNPSDLTKHGLITDRADEEGTMKKGVTEFVDDSGTIVKGLGDGKIDFTVVPTGVGAGMVSKIRWYGLPRDVNGDGKIDVDNDVVPIADVLKHRSDSSLGTDPRAAWEYRLPPVPSGGDYMNLPTTPPRRRRRRRRRLPLHLRLAQQRPPDDPHPRQSRRPRPPHPGRAVAGIHPQPLTAHFAAGPARRVFGPIPSPRTGHREQYRDARISERY